MGYPNWFHVFRSNKRSNGPNCHRMIRIWKNDIIIREKENHWKESLKYRKNSPEVHWWNLVWPSDRVIRDGRYAVSGWNVFKSLGYERFSLPINITITTGMSLHFDILAFFSSPRKIKAENFRNRRRNIKLESNLGSSFWFSVETADIPLKETG